MNYTVAVFLINPNVRAVICRYEPGENVKDTTFKTLDTSIKAGDLVVVPTKTRHGMTVVKVTETDVDIDFDSSVEVSWIVAKIDTTEYTATIAHEETAIQIIKSAEKTKKRNELAAALLADSAGALKALPIYGENTLPPAPATV